MIRTGDSREGSLVRYMIYRKPFASGLFLLHLRGVIQKFVYDTRASAPLLVPGAEGASARHVPGGSARTRVGRVVQQFAYDLRAPAISPAAKLGVQG